MIKSIFFNIINDPSKRESLNFSKDISEIYKLFRENGYTKDFDSFERELNEFLNSAEIQKLVDKGHYELSDEMLENVSGGAGAFRRALVGGVATLMAALSLSASATTLHNSGYAEPSSSVSQSYDYNGYTDYDQGYNGYEQDYTDSGHIYDSLSNDQDYNEKGQGYIDSGQIYDSLNNDQNYNEKGQGYTDSGHIYDSLSNDQNYNKKDAGSVFNSQVSFDSSTSADSVADESQDDNNNQNVQANVNSNVEVVENKGGPIPPPPPPPPPPAPVYGAANAAKTTKTSDAKHEANAGKDGAQQKSMAEEIAERKIELDKKRAVNKNNVNEKKAENQQKDGAPKDMKALILEQRAKIKKQSGNAVEEKKEDKKQENNNQNAQVNVNNNVEVVENKGGPIPPPPPPPPPPPAPVYDAANAAKTTKTSDAKHEANAGKDGAQQKSMAELIAEKATPGALKKVEKKTANQQKDGAQKDMKALILEQHAKIKKQSGNAVEEKKEDKKQENNNQNAQANVNNNVEVVENKDGPIPPPPPPPPPPPAPAYNAANAAKTTKTSAAKHEANADKGSAKQKSMAELIAEKAKPGALKKVEKKTANQQKEKKQDKNFLQNALSEAIRIRYNNLHMHDDENEVEEDDDWD